jgi:transcription antitermination factor NusG
LSGWISARIRNPQRKLLKLQVLRQIFGWEGWGEAMSVGSTQNSSLEISHMVVEPKWYAIQTGANQEKLVSMRLSDRGVENFLPLYRAIRRRTDRRVELLLPLFSGYLFVKVPLAEKLRVLEVPRVVRMVGFNSVPASIPSEEIETLRAGVTAGRHPQPCPYLKNGCKVQVLHGPFAGATGILLRRKQGLRVAVSIDLILRSFTVEVGEEDIRRVA